MPLYEFFCKRCKKQFQEVMHVEEHDKGVAVCPSCRKKDEVERRMSVFHAVTPRKSAAY